MWQSGRSGRRPYNNIEGKLNFSSRCEGGGEGKIIKKRAREREVRSSPFSSEVCDHFFVSSSRYSRGLLVASCLLTYIQLASSSSSPSWLARLIPITSPDQTLALKKTEAFVCDEITIYMSPRFLFAGFFGPQLRQAKFQFTIRIVQRVTLICYECAVSFSLFRGFCELETLITKSSFKISVLHFSHSTSPCKSKNLSKSQLLILNAFFA